MKGRTNTKMPSLLACLGTLRTLGTGSVRAAAECLIAWVKVWACPAACKSSHQACPWKTRMKSVSPEPDSRDAALANDGISILYGILVSFKVN